MKRLDVCDVCGQEIDAPEAYIPHDKLRKRFPEISDMCEPCERRLTKALIASKLLLLDMAWDAVEHEVGKIRRGE